MCDVNTQQWCRLFLYSSFHNLRFILVPPLWLALNYPVMKILDNFHIYCELSTYVHCALQDTLTFSTRWKNINGNMFQKVTCIWQLTLHKKNNVHVHKKQQYNTRKKITSLHYYLPIIPPLKAPSLQPPTHTHTPSSSHQKAHSIKLMTRNTLTPNPLTHKV